MNQNPIVNCIPNYRKTMISRIKTLTCLEERPIKYEERRLAESWLSSGEEGVEKEKLRLREEKEQSHQRYLWEIRQRDA